MRDVLNELTQWLQQSKKIALATVVQTWGSAPRPVGANMAITAQGEMAGSVSGGCVEGAVVDASLEVLQSGVPRLLHFGVADETAWDVGLSCGGTIEIFVRPLETEIAQLWQTTLKDGKSIAAVTLIQSPQDTLGNELILLENGDVQGSLGSDLDHQALDYARSALADGTPRRVPHAKQDAEFFVNVDLPAPTLVVVGGVHIAIPLVALAKTLGYRTVVIDPRRMFGSQTRFSNVDQLIQSWPEKAFEGISLTSSTAVAMLTHDPKIDDPALQAALPSPAFYVGALGSRKTHAKRRHRLLEAGMPADQLDRLRAPIGLDLGGRSPEEIALAVMAQIVQIRHG